jgi:hypothetical protein
VLPAKRFERFCKLRTDPQVSNASKYQSQDWQIDWPVWVKNSDDPEKLARTYPPQQASRNSRY